MKTLFVITQWIGRRKMLFVLVVLSASGHALALMMARPALVSQPMRPPGGETRVLWSPMPPENSRGLMSRDSQRENDAVEIFDPSLIANPGDRGFSSRISTGLTSVLYQWPAPTVAPRPAVMSMIQGIRVPAIAEASLAQMMADRLSKAVAPSFEEVGDVFLAETIPVAALELQGNLQQRRLLQPFQLPELMSAPPTRPCVFRLAVDAEGRVSTVVLESSSGNDAADDKVADALRHCRFAPEESGPEPLRGIQPPKYEQPALQWGKASIVWSASPPPPAEKSAPPTP